MSFSEDSVKPFKGQVYGDLASEHDESNLFEDPIFPATDSSMYFSQRPPQGVRWLRPKEITNNPEFSVADFQRCDMDQGQLGNCWFIAASVGLLQVPKLFSRVVPENQSFSENYAGIFHFRFWLYGEWTDVVIDDRLPVFPDGRLVFCSNKQQPNEFWGPLLEKAYAKLYGSYEALDAGQTYDALIDMSGGIQEQFDLKKLESNVASNFWEIICKGFEKNSIMGCSINADPSVKEARLANGLVRGHAYTITNVAEVSGNQLLRIRNPWGNDVEWKGAWSDGSSEWRSVSQSVKDELGFEKAADGEFWMAYRDFMRNWDNVQICHLSVDSFSTEVLAEESNIKWQCTPFHSAWKAGVNAGGCGQNDTASYWTNPQFLINLYDVDENDNEEMCTVIIALMQKDSRLRRSKSKNESGEEFIQFRLFKVHDDVDIEEYKSSGNKLYASQLDRLGSSGAYINSREVTHRFRVPPGNYLIIPSTYEANQSCEFMIRVFTEHEIESGNLPQDKDVLDDEDKVLDDVPEDFKWKKFISHLSPHLCKFLRRILDERGSNLGRYVTEENFNSAASAFGHVSNSISRFRDGNLDANDIKNTFNSLQDTFSKFKF